MSVLGIGRRFKRAIYCLLLLLLLLIAMGNRGYIARLWRARVIHAAAVLLPVFAFIGYYN